MKKRGKGIAAMFYPIGFTSYPNPGAAFMKVNQDGTAHLYIGTADIGQGSTTVLAQIAAEELGIDYDKVTVVAGDTKLTPFDHGHRRQPRDLYRRQRRAEGSGAGQADPA